ncbi:MAG: 16S rRNA (cytosine(1402)-N(4))-methyltransferase [Gemmatimonadetes bacterium 13_1_40CM_70_11]|nr:MAG: 16S rRNA (cytosine(1402)-N(4))-methyltransferase [Gemmatimonadetes bacterium 13_1_40CM_70_11]
MLAETVRAWAAGSRRAVDATVGGGGHAALLREGGADVLAIDRDPEAIAAARARLGDERVRYLTAPFAAPEALAAVAAFRPDRVLLDLGLSSHQVDSPDRGFTFRPGAPLDMRMTPGSPEGPSAAEVLNSWPAERLAACFADYADEPYPLSRALAREVIRRRSRAPLLVSDDFVNAIRALLGPRSGPTDFARLFQALRVAVNDELGQLERALPALRSALTGGGRLAVITYHSGEDRIVKHTFREWSQACVCPPRQPVCTCRGRPLGRLLTRKAVVPAADERRANPRARSAKFRAFEVTDGAAR